MTRMELQSLMNRLIGKSLIERITTAELTDLAFAIDEVCDDLERQIEDLTPTDE